MQSPTDFSHLIFRRIGLHIRAERLRRGLNQNNFAQLCGLSRHQIRSLEEGLGEFRFTNFLKICHALQCEPHILMQSLSDIQMKSRHRRDISKDDVKISHFESGEPKKLHMARLRMREKSVYEIEITKEQIEFIILKGPVYKSRISNQKIKRG